MADLEAQRTLVKSPPELWAELSDPGSLARRLSDFGEIRITRLVPETTVAWEGERASGTVELESSGWGTKVRLTARSSTAAAPVSARDRIVAVLETHDEQGEVNAEPAPAADDASEDGPAGTDLPAGGRRTSSAAERSAARVARRAAETAAAATVVEAPASPSPVPAPAAPAPAGRPGFFTRLFRRRRDPAAATGMQVTQPAGTSPEPPPSDEPLPAPPSRHAGCDEEQTLPHATLARPQLPDESARYAAPMSGSSAPNRAPSAAAGQRPAVTAPPAGSPAAERAPASRLDPERTMALLTGVLDDLGSAHHRPFSRE